MKDQTEETKMKHTPTPVSVYYDDDNCRTLVMRGDVLIADCGKGVFGKSEALRIVRAVNNFERINQELKNIRQLIRGASQVGPVRALERIRQELESFDAESETIDRAEGGSK